MDFFRKHRKGMVRRIKPVEEESLAADANANESIVYVPADEDTVYIQAENVEETETNSTEENTSEIREKEETQEKGDVIVQPSRSSGSSKYGVSLYNYSKTKTKPAAPTRDNDSKSPKGQGASNIDIGGSTKSPQGGFSRDQYHSKYYHDFPKQDRGFYPESGAHSGRYYVGNHEPYQKYRKSKYEIPPSFYTSSHQSSKGPINSKATDRYKTDTYLPYDKYRTMANLPEESANTKKNTNENLMNKTLKKGSLIKTETNSEGTKSSKSTVESVTNKPPQLVFVVSQNEDAENTSTFDKSPPALEKCESSYAEDDLLKVEDEESQDSVNGEENKDNPNSTQEDAEPPTTIKLV